MSGCSLALLINQQACPPPSAVSCGSVLDSRPRQSVVGVPFVVCAGIRSRLLKLAYNACIFVSGSRCCSHSGIFSVWILILAALIFFRTLTQRLMVAKLGFSLAKESWSWEN